jgi:hypothetical protein
VGSFFAAGVAAALGRFSVLLSGAFEASWQLFWACWGKALRAWSSRASSVGMTISSPRSLIMPHRASVKGRDKDG